MPTDDLGLGGLHVRHPFFHCPFCTEVVSANRKAYRNQSLEQELGVLGLKFATETIAND